MIDENLTLKLFGYKSINLTPRSAKKIVCRCDICGKIRIKTKHDYRSLCRSCVQKGKKAKLPQRGTYLELDCVDEKATYNEFGYYSTQLKPRSAKKIIIICKNCNKIRVVPKDAYRELCQSCWQIGRIQSDETKLKRSIANKGEKSSSWLGGISFGKYCPLFNENFKEQVRKFYHRKCFLCNKSEEDNNRKLSVHHVNYNKNCLCGDQCEFVPLCNKCHSKTNFNRKYWEDLIMCYLYPDRFFMIDL